MRRALGLLLTLLLAGAAAAPFARAADATVITGGESLRNVILAGSGVPGTAATRLEVDNLNVLPQNPYTAPYEDLRLRAR